MIHAHTRTHAAVVIRLGRKNYTRGGSGRAIISRPTDTTRDSHKKYLIGILTLWRVGDEKKKNYFRLGIIRRMINDSEGRDTEK